MFPFVREASASEPRRPRVVIIGAGFGGLRAVRLISADQVRERGEG